MVDQQTPATAVRRSIVVDAPQDRAFAVFTEQMTSWWPLASHALGARPVVAAVVEPAEMRETYGSDGGWAGLLHAFAAAADGGDA